MEIEDEDISDEMKEVKKHIYRENNKIYCMSYSGDGQKNGNCLRHAGTHLSTNIWYL